VGQISIGGLGQNYIGAYMATGRLSMPKLISTATRAPNAGSSRFSNYNVAPGRRLFSGSVDYCGSRLVRRRWGSKQRQRLRRSLSMAGLTIAANAYRWACPMVEQMMRHRPAIALDLLRADTATKHFVALAMRGWESRQDRCDRALRQLSEDLFSRPRRVVLAEIWGVELGKLGFLRRLPGRVLSRRHHAHLVTAWCDPRRRKLLSQCARISSGEIEAIAMSISRSTTPRFGSLPRSARSFPTTCWLWCGGIGPTSTTWVWQPRYVN
jgi:hypothetical protein